MPVAEQVHAAPEELLRMPDAERYELVDGELVAQEMNVESTWVSGRCFATLNAYVVDRKLGLAFPDGLGYRCFSEDLDRIRRPDASFIAKGRLDAEQFREGYCLVAPDLAVEVVSPGDLYIDVQRKVGEYRRAGVRLIWVLSPAERAITVYRGNGELIELTEHEELTGFDVLPGFRCAVRDLFAPADLRAALSSAD